MEFSSIAVVDSEFRELFKQIITYEKQGGHVQDFLNVALEKAMRNSRLSQSIDIQKAKDTYTSSCVEELRKAKLGLDDTVLKAATEGQASLIETTCDNLERKAVEIQDKLFQKLHKASIDNFVKQLEILDQKADDRIMEAIRAEPMENRKQIVDSLYEAKLLTAKQAGELCHD